MDRIQLRRDSSARWAEVNPILLEGEVGFETDTKLRKIGDGVHRWNELEYLKAEGIVQESGDGENVVMSQKAVSKEFAEVKLSIEKSSLKKSNYDFAVADENGNAIMEISEGHIKTKNFDSRKIVSRYGSFSIIGDSYSTYSGKTNPTANKQWYPTTDTSAEGYNSGNDVTELKQMWWYIFANEYQSVLLENNSYSGSTICYDGYSSGHDSNAAKTSFCKRIEQMQGKPELLFIFGGTNDSWAKSELGEYKYFGWTEEDKSYYRPALAYLIDYVRNNMIGTKIVFVLNDGLSTGIVESTTIVCDYYGVDVIRLSNIDKIGSHPSASGMMQIKEQIIKNIR